MGHVINIDQFNFSCRVRDGNGHIACDVVTEGGYHRIIVGTAPFAEDALQAKDKDRRPRFPAKVENGFFCLALGKPIRIIKSGLGR